MNSPEINDDGTAVASLADEEAEALVKQEVDRIRGFVSGLSMEDVKTGDWFVKLLSFALDQYVRKVDADYFKTKYPDLPPDAVVDAQIKIAADYAAIEGGLTSAAYTGAVAATIGSGGGASPLTLPAAGLSFVVDLSYTSYLQLRMAYDISVLYGVPIDHSDPEDMRKLVRLAFGIKAGEVTSSGMMKAMPALIRPAIKKVFSGSTLAAVKSLPVIGRHLLQRNIIKFAIPVITIPVTTAVNRWITKFAGNQAKTILRREAKIIEASRRIVEQSKDVQPVLTTLWWIINADKSVQPEEILLLRHFIETVRDGQSLDLGENFDQYLEGFRSQIEVDEEDLWHRLSQLSHSDAVHLYRAAVIATAVDGKISRQEAAQLQLLAERLGLEHNEELIDEIERQWK